MAGVSVHFLVVGQVEVGCSMYVTGDQPELGQWIADQGIPLYKQESSMDKERTTWIGTLTLPRNKAVLYRFFIGKLISTQDIANNDLPVKVEVLWWETNVQPRQFNTQDQDKLELPLAEFGFYDGSHTCSNGWLQHESCIQVRFHSDPIFMLKARHHKQLYSIKCTPLNFDPGSPTDLQDVSSGNVFDEEDSHSGPPPCSKTAVYYHNLNSDNLKPVLQSSTGCIYNKGDYLVFIARGANYKHVGFQVDFFVHIKGADPKFIGSAHLLPPKTEVSFFSKKIPIVGLNNRPLGEVSVETLHICPLPGYVGSMEVSYQNHWKWKTNGTTLNVGHRGMGSSYKQKMVSNIRENTINSLNSAASNGADFVEFDVLLCKDLVPVIYHDFSVCLSYVSKNGRDRQLLEIPVKDLSLEHLQSMKLYHSSSEPENHIEVNPEFSPEDQQPFPTLQRCLESVDPHVGFNVEVKYPLQIETGEYEMDNYFDLNPYIDRILTILLKHAGNRKIIFSTFDPDTCIMIQMKQNKYPVLFLSNGPTRRYSQYKDWRCTSFHHGICFAKAEGFLGVNFQAEGLIQDLPLIQQIKSMGMVVFVWGEDLNEPHVKQLLRKHDVDGIIFDRIEKHHEPFVVDTAAELDNICTIAHIPSPTQTEPPCNLNMGQ